jgi:signal transduction histidine kinase
MVAWQATPALSAHIGDCPLTPINPPRSGPPAASRALRHVEALVFLHDGNILGYTAQPRTDPLSVCQGIDRGRDLASTSSNGIKTEAAASGIGAIILPFVVWATVAFTALAALGYITVTHLNDLDRTSQRHLAQTALMLERDRISSHASEYSWWDVATKSLFPVPDLDWIAENIGEHAQQNLDIDFTLVISRDDKIQIALRDTRPATVDPEFIRNPDIQALIHSARKSPMDPIVGASGFGLFDGQVYIFGVAPFSPENPDEGAPPDPRRPVLIFGRRMDAKFLEAQGLHFGFKDLRLAPPTSVSHHLITSPTNVPLAGLTWKIRASGTELTARLIVPAIVVLTILAVLAWYFLRRAQAMSEALVRASDVTVRQNDQLRVSEAEAVRSQELAEQASTEKDQALVSLRQRNEELLIARQEAMQASHAKTMFLASMSHELRTPLNAIIGFSEILKDERFGPLGTDRYVEYADNIRSSGAHLLSLINDVLDISKIEAGKMTLEPELVVVDDLCAGTLKLFREQAHSGRIALSFASTPPDITIEADPRALRQILVNLISNALKFTRPGDEISVRAAREPTEVGEGVESQVKIVVADSGIGIPEEFQNAVFLPFNQGGGSSDNEGGTGLGLALVKSLTELHGGHVALNSVQGQGTTVAVHLPLVAAR